jgi:hypothetical protein
LATLATIVVIGVLIAAYVLWVKPKAILSIHKEVVGHLQVPAPDGWVHTATSADVVLHLKAPSGPGEEGVGDGTSTASLPDAVAIYLAAAQFTRPGLTVPMNQSISIQGASHAAILVTRYDLNPSNGPHQTVDAIDLFASADQFRAAHLTLVVPIEQDTENLRSQLMAQFQLLPTGSPVTSPSNP